VWRLARARRRCKQSGTFGDGIPVAKGLGKFVLHALVAMPGSMLTGGFLFLIAFYPWVSKERNPWLDVPYSPIFWGTGFVLGFLLNRSMRNSSAKWVWLVGVLWLIVMGASEVRTYDPRWCLGCSLRQYVWDSLFSYWNCSQECLGQALVTAPMLSSVAYSVGAVVGNRFGLRRPARAAPAG
jgi:hypothetical protein